MHQCAFLFLFFHSFPFFILPVLPFLQYFFSIACQSLGRAQSSTAVVDFSLLLAASCAIYDIQLWEDMVAVSGVAISQTWHRMVSNKLCLARGSSGTRPTDFSTLPYPPAFERSRGFHLSEASYLGDRLKCCNDANGSLATHCSCNFEWTFEDIWSID